MVEAPALLGPDEPAPFQLENPQGRSPLVFVCEHGGHRIPAALGSLGLEARHLRKHFMVDLWAIDLARALARAFDAPLAHQPYSRMVCDCNRRPDVESFIPEAGEGVAVPGNRDLDAAARARREAAIWAPFHARVAALLDARAAAGRRSLLVTIHSFTPVFHGRARPWHAGVLYDRDTALSPLLFEILESRHGGVIGCNEPYAMGRDTDYTVPVHGEDRGLPATEIEVRNDLIADAGGRAAWTERLGRALQRACGELGVEVSFSHSSGGSLS